MENKKNKGKLKIETRREFLKTFSGMAASALVLGSCSPSPGSENGEEPQALVPRTGVTNPFVTDTGRPILVCVRGTDFARMLRAGMETLGGFGRLVGNRDVLIKPNLNHCDPFPGISSPDSIIDIVREVQLSSTGNIFVGDMGHETNVYGYLNLESLVTSAGATLLNFGEFYKVRRSTWETGRPDFMVYSDVYNAPVIISTCCLKRHSWASLTCAIKCNVGCVNGPGAGGTRHYLHYQSQNFMQELAEIAGLINLELTIVDARSILTRGGPMIQNGTVVDGVNRIIICGDMVATDVYCAGIMEEYDDTFSISSIEETLQHAVELGLGTSDLNQVEIIEIQA
ncbi:MAG: DUF362 domain-containing protein [Candidatus Aminicenantes bacterium]|nr:DUF362 domain-containing protein [Candidatus Aminicenantes bacterium]